jgi:hypothetical protein
MTDWKIGDRFRCNEDCFEAPLAHVVTRIEDSGLSGLDAPREIWFRPEDQRESFMYEHHIHPVS